MIAMTSSQLEVDQRPSIIIVKKSDHRTSNDKSMNFDIFVPLLLYSIEINSPNLEAVSRLPVNVPTYLVAQNIYGPRFATPKYLAFCFFYSAFQFQPNNPVVCSCFFLLRPSTKPLHRDVTMHALYFL